MNFGWRCLGPLSSSAYAAQLLALMPALAGWRIGVAEGFEFKIIVACCGVLGLASFKMTLQPSPRLAEAMRNLSSEGMVLQ